MEMIGYDFPTMARQIIHRINYKNFKCYIEKSSSFGWCHYAFRYITTDKSLKILDEYTKDTLKAMRTGRYNKAHRTSVSDEEFDQLGLVSLADLYHLYKKDFDYYCEVIDLM